MARFVQIDVAFDEPWRTRASAVAAPASEFARGGVLLGHVGLRVRDARLLQGAPVALNVAARNLARSALEGHEPGDDPLRALFPCPLDLGGRGGVVRDARVRLVELPPAEGAERHPRRLARLDAFVGMDDDEERTFDVPRGAWARQVLKLATWVVRRCPAEPPEVVDARWHETYRTLREETRELAAKLREARKRS